MFQVPSNPNNFKILRQEFKILKHRSLSFCVSFWPNPAGTQLASHFSLAHPTSGQPPPTLILPRSPIPLVSLSPLCSSSPAVHRTPPWPSCAPPAMAARRQAAPPSRSCASANYRTAIGLTIPRRTSLLLLSRCASRHHGRAARLRPWTPLLIASPSLFNGSFF